MDSADRAAGFEALSDELDLFLGERNREYYRDRWVEIESTGMPYPATWNWAACFLGIYWLVYRKMYWYAVIVFLVSLLASTLNYHYFSFSMALFLGLYGNSLYYRKALKKLHKIKLHGDIMYRQEDMRKSGGTNIVLAVLAAIAHLAYLGFSFLKYL